MAQLIQLTYVVVYGVEIEVGGYIRRVLLIGRVLYWAEIVDLHASWNYYHAAGMLARGALHAGTAQGQPLLFGLMQCAVPLFSIALYISVGCFLLYAGYGPRFKHVVPAE